MTPDEAEAEARQLGLEPFARIPGPGCFNPATRSPKDICGRGPRSKASALELPPLISPVGNGYMPLSVAAQWISTHGGAVKFDAGDSSGWKDGFAQLLDSLASEKVKITGVANGNSELVPGHHFAYCPITYPYQEIDPELLSDDALHLRGQPYDDVDDWHDGFSDTLMKGFEERWSRLMVLKSDILKWWPFDVLPLASGAPGRPTSMHLIFDELKRRCRLGQLELSLSKQAEALSAWLASEHPHFPPTKAKTVTNQIGPTYREMRLSPKNNVLGLFWATFLGVRQLPSHLEKPPETRRPLGSFLWPIQLPNTFAVLMPRST